MKLTFGNLRAACLLLLSVLACGAAARAQQRPAPAAGESLTAEQAVARYERVLEAATTPSRKFYLTTKLAPTALAAGQDEKAKSYARALLEQAPSLEKDWNHGNAVHAANTVLGLLALKAGDVGEAGRLLLASAGHRGSAQLNSFGPDMVLANELLAKGGRDVVKQYLDLCDNFWEVDFGKLDRWKEEVTRGETPNFGPNLDRLRGMWRFESWAKLQP